MTRRNRDQIERIEAISIGVHRVGNAANWTLVAFIGSGAGSGALLGYAIDATTWRATAGGAGIGGLLGLILFTAAAWDLARQTIDLQRMRRDGDGFPFHETGPTSRARYPIVYDDRGREVGRWTRAEYVEYMTAALDEDDDTGFNQRDAARFGHDRETFNALVEWCADRGWYRYANGVDNRNGGEFVAPRRTILDPTPDDGNV